MLTLLLGSFYQGGVCELDAAECRQNYAKEFMPNVAARVQVDVPAAVQLATPAAVLAAPGDGRRGRWLAVVLLARWA
ncbi:hypothetical protein [Hymenobacter lapidarius]|uniref:hypothetical protein n=1 Tax=Hymenobacter lapidarius TaxID=1908237 RepID=UPI000F791FDE|nr:hypothetical protein [Hymenobacter lapidarius]